MSSSSSAFSLSDLGNTYSELGDWISYGLAAYNSTYYDQGRWSNGPLWIEDIALKFGFAALQRNEESNLYGTDFAYGGSTSFSGSSFGGLLPNLQTQVSYYIALLPLVWTTTYSGTVPIRQGLATGSSERVRTNSL